MTLTHFGCAEAFQRLDDYLDRELEPEERARVAEHLEICARCASEFSLEREVLEDIRMKIRRIRAPQGLRERILAHLPRG